MNNLLTTILSQFHGSSHAHMGDLYSNTNRKNVVWILDVIKKRLLILELKRILYTKKYGCILSVAYSNKRLRFCVFIHIILIYSYINVVLFLFYF